MHELSIVMSIVDIAEKEAIKANVDSFSQIELTIGSQSGIVMEALDFAWNSGVKNTVLENAKLSIKHIKAISKCSDCGYTFEIENLYDACPKCNSLFTDLIQGNELQISSLSYDK